MNITGQITNLALITSGSLFGIMKTDDGRLISLAFLADDRSVCPDLDAAIMGAVDDRSRPVTLTGFPWEKTWGNGPSAGSCTYFFVTDETISDMGATEFKDRFRSFLADLVQSR